MRIQDNYKLSSYGDFLESLHNHDISEIRDFTDNGKCRDCGNCCGNFIPLTFDDYKRIKHYIKGHGIAPARPRLLPGPFVKPIAHNLCPFLLDKEEHRCAIYPVRPKICEKWTCHDPGRNQGLVDWCLSSPYMETVDMYMMFYPDQTIQELKKSLKEVL